MAEHGGSHCCGPGYASPAEAMKAPARSCSTRCPLHRHRHPEAGLPGDDRRRPGQPDLQPGDQPAGDARHGRRAAPHGLERLLVVPWRRRPSERRYLIVPGVRSSEPPHRRLRRPTRKAPSLHKVIEADEIKAKTNLSAPHTVHCLGSDIIISMLGDAGGQRARRVPAPEPGLQDRRPLGERPRRHEVQLRFLVPAAPQRDGLSEWAAPNTFMPGFDLEEVGQLKYGREIHFWDFQEQADREDRLPGRGRA